MFTLHRSQFVIFNRLHLRGLLLLLWVLFIFVDDLLSLYLDYLVACFDCFYNSGS